jgi:hypothetical protein
MINEQKDAAILVGKTSSVGKGYALVEDGVKDRALEGF